MNDTLATWWAMVKADAELAGETILPQAVILSYSGCGASVSVTAEQLDEHFRKIGEYEEALNAAAASESNVAYRDDFDTSGYKACCHIIPYVPHRESCWVRKVFKALGKPVPGDQDER